VWALAAVERRRRCEREEEPQRRTAGGGSHRVTGHGHPILSGDVGRTPPRAPASRTRGREAPGIVVDVARPGPRACPCRRPGCGPPPRLPAGECPPRGRGLP